MDVKDLSSNWKKLQAKLNSTKLAPTSSAKPPSEPVRGQKRNFSEVKNGATSKVNGHIGKTHSTRKRARIMSTSAPNTTREEILKKTGGSEVPNGATSSSIPRTASTENLVNAGLSADIETGRYIAIDCEMVGVGPHPDLESALARVSIVNYNGEQVYDSYVRPMEPVTDWRTHVSGILPQHMTDARSLDEVQKDVSRILKDRVVIGHSLRNDFKALLLSHPKRDLRDTARHPPYRKLAGGSYPRLKILASDLLGLHIQNGEHSSLEDARACMLLFRKDKASFEKEHSKHFPAGSTIEKPKTEVDPDSSKQKTQSKKKKKKKK